MNHTNPKGKENFADYYTNPECSCDTCEMSRTFEADMQRRTKVAAVAARAHENGGDNPYIDPAYRAQLQDLQKSTAAASKLGTVFNAVQAVPQDRERGLYAKYQISRTDGKPLDKGALFFVLRYDAEEAITGDKLEEGFTALLALRTYANAIRPTHPQLAADLITAIEAEGVKLRAYRDANPGKADAAL